MEALPVELGAGEPQVTGRLEERGTIRSGTVRRVQRGDRARGRAELPCQSRKRAAGTDLEQYRSSAQVVGEAGETLAEADWTAQVRGPVLRVGRFAIQHPVAREVGQNGNGRGTARDSLDDLPERLQR